MSQVKILFGGIFKLNLPFHGEYEGESVLGKGVQSILLGEVCGGLVSNLCDHVPCLQSYPCRRTVGSNL